MELRIVRLGALMLGFGFLTRWAFYPSWSFFVAAIVPVVFALSLYYKEAEDRVNRRVHERAQVPRGAAPGLPMTNHTQVPFGPPPVVPQQPAMPPGGQFSPNYDLEPE